MGDIVALLIIIKQLAFENCNAVCKAALRPFRKSSISEYIRISLYICRSYTQGLTIDADLQWKTLMFSTNLRPREKKGYRASGRLLEVQPYGTSDQAMVLWENMARDNKRNRIVLEMQERKTLD